MSKKSTKTIFAILILVVVAGAIAAIVTSGKKSSQMASTTGVSLSSAVATNAVSIQDYMYMPSTIKVKVGTTVTWTNKDAVEHSVTADNASKNAPNGPLFGQNKTYTYTFNTAGTYTFHCILHPYMHSAVIVTG